MIKKRKRKDGTTVYDITVYTGRIIDGKRERQYAHAETMHNARVLEAAMISDNAAMLGRTDALTLAQYVQLYYWPQALKRLAPTTLDTYEQEIRLRILPTLGNVKLREITRQHVQKMIDSCKSRPVAKKSVGTLKTILNEAISDGHITANPACYTLALPTTGQHRDNGLVLQSFAEIYDVLAIVREHGSNCIQRIAYTGLLQGLRPEERYALDWANLDTHKRTITIKNAFVTVSKKHGGNQLKDTKNKPSFRVIPMHHDFVAWLVQQPCGNGAFIVGADGNRISPSTARHRWQRFLLDNPTVPPVTIENMRHSFATAYLAAGGRIEILSRLLGHSNINTTIDRYYRPDVELLRGDFDAINGN